MHFFVATNAPGRSAINRVDCRMVKFSQELSSLVLPLDSFGSHLNSKGETIDNELASIWSKMMIDGHPVLAEYISKETDLELIKKSEEWKSMHVRESQYFLQIVKCKWSAGL